MVLDNLDKKLESNRFYQLYRRHKRFFIFLEGLIIIILMIIVDVVVVNDHFLKKEIAKNCGYTNGNIQCICQKSYVDNHKSELTGLDYSLLNNLSIGNLKNVQVDR